MVLLWKNNILKNTFSASHVYWQLAGDGKSVAELRLSGSKFSEHFRDRPGLHAAVQKLVQLFGACCYLMIKLNEKKHWMNIIDKKLCFIDFKNK